MKQEAVMGIDLVTGEKLSWQERGISLVCMFVPVVSGKAVTKGGKKLFVSISKIPGKVKKVRNVVSKNTLKIKVYLKKVWSATKEGVKINFRKGKDCVVKLKNCSLNELQKMKESGHTFLENVKKIKNGEFYQYECAMPDGQRIPISGWDETPKSKVLCSSNKAEFITDNRVPLDKETILSNSNYVKTKNKVKGASVYKKGDKYFYRDTLHKGERAHLEVFDKKGNHIGEADPLTGELLANSADKSKKLKLK